MRKERLKTIQRVRDKSAALAENCLGGEELRVSKIHTNLEVCTLLDEIDQLTSALEELRDMLGDCTCDEPEKSHDSVVCHAYFVTERTLAV